MTASGERANRTKPAKRREPLTPIGWREWITLPDLDVEWVKAKIDTGARSSSLHAWDLHEFERDGALWLRFEVHPWQRSMSGSVIAEAPLHEYRSVKSSSGQSEKRPVIHTTMLVGAQQITIDVTLTRRDEMGFRMLIGREALRRRFTVDPGRSYLTGKPPQAILRANRARPNALRTELDSP